MRMEVGNLSIAAGRNRRRAFTMIEVLMAIAIIAVLAGMLVVGLQYISSPGKANATKVAFETARALLAEHEASAGIGGLPAGAVIVPAGAAADLGEGRPGRYGQLVVDTQRALRLMLASPVNKKAYGQIPAERLLRVVWASGVQYDLGDQVEYPAGSGTYYRCTQATTSQPGSGGAWISAPQHTPVPLDGWGNPIIFVRRPDVSLPNPALDNAYGLKYVSLGGTNKRITSPPNPPYIEGGASDPGTASRLRANLAIYRPFWASAGPDGRLNTGDDNVYSFEN